MQQPGYQPMLYVSEWGKERKKGKEEYLYRAILADTPFTKCSDMEHTVLPAKYAMSAFPS